ncbi:MAG: DUF4845 domain-containing protein [Rhodocyclales bacterium GWA2_65_20]|nr:MAG: DUF4845 domain-containing protein [Rhodocyclales bacterium GWA2_65_20]
MKKQRGVTLVSLVFFAALIILVALLGIKVAPEVIEYYAVIKDTKATAVDPASKDATVAQIRQNFDKRKLIDNITVVDGNDLDISKDGNDIVIAFAYTRKIPLYGPVSLVIDFEGTTAK